MNPIAIPDRAHRDDQELERGPKSTGIRKQQMRTEYSGNGQERKSYRDSKKFTTTSHDVTHRLDSPQIAHAPGLHARLQRQPAQAWAVRRRRLGPHQAAPLHDCTCMLELALEHKCNDIPMIDCSPHTKQPNEVFFLETGLHFICFCDNLHPRSYKDILDGNKITSRSLQELPSHACRRRSEQPSAAWSRSLFWWNIVFDWHQE